MTGPARRLLLTCDDLGIHDGATAGIVAALDDGIATSTSLMTPPPASAGALELLRGRPDLDVGVHVTLTSDFAAQPWSPVAGAERVPSLVGDDGHLRPQSEIPRLLAEARLADVEREVRAQLAVALDAGLRLSHLDWHCIADGGRPDLADLTVRLAREHGLAARVWLDDPRAAARSLGLPVVDHPFLDSFAWDPGTKQRDFCDQLRALRPGLTEWAVHPAVDDDAIRALDDGWPVRTSDLAFLLSDEARAVVEEEGIELCDYRGLQRAWVAAG